MSSVSRMVLENGDFEYVFKFNTVEDLEKWKVSTDAGYKVGESKAKLSLTDNQTAHFCGYLSRKFDKPEATKALYTGYANIQSLPQYWSFSRQKNLDFKGFTHFLLKIRGDGRTYAMVLNTPEAFSETLFNTHTTPIYTRGGPYWQYVKVPFSKFFHASHGRVSDKQFRFSPTAVKTIGLTLMDHNEGPFSLEIDSIAVVKDEASNEEFAYEMYQVEKYIANT
jgi:NADH dehydrogenase [ubiquinone] 1 alpha subcomplex assembly factor 1